jgi:Putative phage abortive infection protein
MALVIIMLLLQTGFILVVLLYLILEITKIQHARKLSQQYTSNWDKKTSWILALVIGLLISSFFAPKVITSGLFGFKFDATTGQAGDTVSGLMNPFIGMAAVLTTGLAFYIQYQANEQGREQFWTQLNIQKFESQFYEMLKLHRQNVEEISITGYDFDESRKFKKYDKTIEGRKVFVSMKTELECIYSIYWIKKKQLNTEDINRCYYLFFFGLDQFESEYPGEKKLISSFRRARKQHQYPDAEITTNEARKQFFVFKSPVSRSRKNQVKLNFNYKPFSGHSSRLGHYFRHLFLTVKSTAASDVVTEYPERMKYLKMLRAQLSNHEQMLLFYNWLGGFGNKWENDKNKFFTEYRMIHNLWYQNIFKHDFFNQKIGELEAKETKLRGNDKLFEMDETDE